MEYWITSGGHPEDVCFATRGLCSPRDIHAMTQEALADSRWRDGLNVLIDQTQSDWAAMPTDELTEFARLLREFAPAFGQQRVGRSGTQTEHSPRATLRCRCAGFARLRLGAE
jgi:hypothetical protein